MISDPGQSAEPPSTEASPPVLGDNPMGGAIGTDADFEEATSEEPATPKKEETGPAGGGGFDPDDMQQASPRRKQSLQRWRGSWFGGAQPPSGEEVAVDTSISTSKVSPFFSGLDVPLSTDTSKVSVVMVPCARLLDRPPPVPFDQRQHFCCRADLRVTRTPSFFPLSSRTLPRSSRQSRRTTWRLSRRRSPV